MCPLEVNEDIKDPVDTCGGVDNSGELVTSAIYYTPATAVLGYTQAAFYFHCDTGSAIDGFYIEHSYDGTNFATFINNEQNMTASWSVADITGGMVNGTVVGIIVPKAGTYLSVPYIRFKFEIAAGAQLINLDVKCIRFPLDRPALSVT